MCVLNNSMVCGIYVGGCTPKLFLVRATMKAVKNTVEGVKFTYCKITTKIRWQLHKWRDRLRRAVLGGLGLNEKMIIIGASDEPVEVPINQFIAGRQSIVGWYSGTSIDSQDTLSFSAVSGVRSMNEVFPLERAAEAYDLMMGGKVRFRAVLTTTAR